MRLGLDARFFGPQETGIGRYVERLITHLTAIDQKNHYVVFLRRRAFDWWQPPNERWSKVLADYRWYGLAEQRVMPYIFRRARLDLLHVPHFNVPIFYRRPFVVTIHDLILDEFPTERATTLEPILFALKFRAYRAVVRHAVKDSQALITVSQYSQRKIAQQFQIPTAKMTVTYESVDPLSNPVPWELLAEHGVQQPYLLHVGNTYPHKNLTRLIDAFVLLRQRYPTIQLVLVGKRDYFARQLEQYCQSRQVRNVRFYGFASDQELAALYQHAHAYIFPSLSEGFGLPGLEAMQAGIPVVAARASCLPEVFGEAALFFDPYDIRDMAASIDRILRDTLLRQNLIAAGHQRLRQYSWRRMAEQTLQVYHQCRPHA